MYPPAEQSPPVRPFTHPTPSTRYIITRRRHRNSTTLFPKVPLTNQRLHRISYTVTHACTGYSTIKQSRMLVPHRGESRLLLNEVSERIDGWWIRGVGHWTISLPAGGAHLQVAVDAHPHRDGAVDPRAGRTRSATEPPRNAHTQRVSLYRGRVSLLCTPRVFFFFIERSI